MTGFWEQKLWCQTIEFYILVLLTTCYLANLGSCLFLLCFGLIVLKMGITIVTTDCNGLRWGFLKVTITKLHKWPFTEWPHISTSALFISFFPYEPKRGEKERDWDRAMCGMKRGHFLVKIIPVSCLFAHVCASVHKPKLAASCSCSFHSTDRFSF